jgi:large subunit ribosomal protein L21
MQPVYPDAGPVELSERLDLAASRDDWLDAAGPSFEWTVYAPHAAQIMKKAFAPTCSSGRVARLRFQAMYAVIRTGGKQYRVTPGDRIRIETTPHENGAIEFSDIVAFSGEEGKFEQELSGAKVLASVMSEGRGDKILVFKLKRKKQYKKMQGHRQNFVEVKINEILVNGQSFKA